MVAASRRKQQNFEYVGDWMEIGLEKMHGSGGKRYSISDIMLRQEYKLAMEGELSAVRHMMRMIDTIIKARDEAACHVIEIIRGDEDKVAERPRNADLALLILGICSVSDASCQRLENASGAGYDQQLRMMSPCYIEPWVVELAKSRESGGHDKPQSCSKLEPSLKLASVANTAKWRENRTRLLSELMRTRGPGATRFKPGQSGNARGRPPRTHPELPYEDFFMEMLTVKIGGKKRQITRLDALMYQLMMMASKGDVKIRRIILPRLSKHYEQEWFAQFERPMTIVRD